MLTNKYAEGYPGKRYYGGCEFVDMAENLARETGPSTVRRRPCQRPAPFRLPGQHGRVFRRHQAGRHHPGHGLDHGGHLTHGSPVSFSGKMYKIVSLRRRQGQREDRLRRARPDRARGQAPDHRRGRLGLCPHHRLRALQEDRRRGRRLPHGRYGTYRGSRRRRGSTRAPSSSPTLRPRPPTRPCAAPAAA